MKKVLITGGAGYIGSHCAKLFIENGYEIVIIDNLSTGHQHTIDQLKKIGNICFYNADLRDEKSVKEVFNKEQDIQGVIHFAAKLSVSESMYQPGEYFKNNVGGTMNLLEAMISNNITNVVFSSTCAVYGESDYLPIDENHPTNPTNPYGESKIIIEKMLDWYHKAFDLNYVALRYFNVCGASEDGLIGDAKKPSVHLMQNAVLGALNLKEFKLTYSTAGTEDGSPIRDYVDVNDLVEAHLKAYEYLVSGGKSDVFNLGTGKGNSVEEIICKVEEITNVKLPREKGEERKGEYAAIYANFDKAKAKLGWKPERSLEKSITSLITWYQSEIYKKEYE